MLVKVLPGIPTNRLTLISICQARKGSSPNPSESQLHSTWVLAGDPIVFFAPRSLERTRLHAFCAGWCISLFSPQKRSHQEKMQRRACTAGFWCWPHSNFDSCDSAMLISANSRTCRCCGSEPYQISWRQAVLLHPIGDGRPNARGVKLDCFPAPSPCYLAALPLGVSRFAYCVVSWPHLLHRYPGPALYLPPEREGRWLRGFAALASPGFTDC